MNPHEFEWNFGNNCTSYVLKDSNCMRQNRVPSNARVQLFSKLHENSRDYMLIIMVN